MGRYLIKARYHAERIEYYYKHGRYAQGEYHYSELCNLILRSERSKKKVF